MDDVTLRRRMGEAGRAVALERFGLDRMLDGMERVFRAVVAQARGAGSGSDTASGPGARRAPREG
jgi:hypothetical protein